MATDGMLCKHLKQEDDDTDMSEKTKQFRNCGSSKGV